MYFAADDWEALHGVLIAGYNNYQRDLRWRPSLIAQELLISGEDHRFFRHPGFDVLAICRAVYRRIFFGVIEGASTIEQQIVRVLTGRYERTFKRKVKEILLATLVTLVVPKPDLPGLYLRVGYYGWRMNSYKDACLRLQMHPSNMSHFDAADLVARLKYPEPQRYSKKRTWQIKKRAKHLLALHSVHRSAEVYCGLKMGVTNATL